MGTECGLVSPRLERYLRMSSLSRRRVIRSVGKDHDRYHAVPPATPDGIPRELVWVSRGAMYFQITPEGTGTDRQI